MDRLLQIESLVHGGDGLARDEGRVVFVPLTVPGDRVRVRLDAPRGGASRGTLLELLEPGAARVVPPCALAGNCGGCDWQQVSESAQREAKFNTVRDALARLGGLSGAPIQPLVPSPLAFRYRRRLRAHLTRDGWGFSARAAHRVIDVPACLLVEEPVERLTHALVAGLREVGLGGVSSFGVDTAEDGRGAVHLELAKAPGLAERKRAERLLERVAGLSGLVVSGGDLKPWALGQPVLVDAGHRRLRVRPDLFAQANRLGARALAEATAATVITGTRVLELFAGAGTLSLAIVEHAGSLVATEGDGPALDLLRASLTENGRTARLVAGPAARVVEGMATERERFDHVVLDPPRTGAKEVLAPLVRLEPARITYVSCDPATFARDAGMLVRAGYRLESVTPWDLFPQTHHVEVLAVFAR